MSGAQRPKRKKPMEALETWMQLIVSIAGCLYIIEFIEKGPPKRF